MYLAASMIDAVKIAQLVCEEWLYVKNGERFIKEELELLAEAFDETIPLADNQFFIVTEDGSIGIMYPNAKEPDWYLVSPEFAVFEILDMTPEEITNMLENSQKNSVKHKYCTNCGAILTRGKFCENCGAKI